MSTTTTTERPGDAYSRGRIAMLDRDEPVWQICESTIRSAIQRQLQRDITTDELQRIREDVDRGLTAYRRIEGRLAAQVSLLPVADGPPTGLARIVADEVPHVDDPTGAMFADVERDSQMAIAAEVHS